MNAKEVISLVPDLLLDNIALETKVDYSVKKLQGKNIFRLFLYGVLNCKIISLRILETIFNSSKFQLLFEMKEQKIKHSGIGMRLTNIDYRYFEKVFQYLINSDPVDEIIFSNKKINARKIDSTTVVISSKLLKFGMDNNVGKKNIKYSVEINQGIPVDIMLFKDQKYLSEDYALPEIIKRKTAKPGLNIAIFDRGIQKKETFIELAKSKIFFISRLTCQKYEVAKNLPLEEKETETLKIISDQVIKLKAEKEKTEAELRLIIGKNKQSKQRIFFLTNIFFLTALEIAELYKSRWEIETFFKFIKQEINFSHLLNRSENGIKVLMYLTMITAILLTIYKKTNNIIGWMVAKIKFLDELEIDLMNNWHTEITPVFSSSNNGFSAYLSSG